MTYINLTAQQAEYFNRTGKLLIVEKMEPQPDIVNTIGKPFRQTLDWDLPDAPPTEKWEEIQNPYHVDSIYGFKEPCDYPVELGRQSIETAFYASNLEVGDRKYHTFFPANDCPEHLIRLFGKCVKSEVRKLLSATGKELNESVERIDNLAFNEKICLEDYCFFSLFEKCEKGAA